MQRSVPAPVWLPLCLLLVLAACGGDAPPAGSAAGNSAAGGVQAYDVRGRVTALPDPADPLSNLRIRHEAIHDFVGIDGAVVGMDSMNMPFPVAGDVSLEGLAVGDPVSFTLEVDWDGDPAYQVTRIEALPADAELTWGEARPPAAEGEQTPPGTGSAPDEEAQD